MKLSLVVLCLFAIAAVCSAKSGFFSRVELSEDLDLLKRGKDDRKDKVRGDKKDKDEEEGGDLPKKVSKNWPPPPVTVELLNNASRDVDNYLPLAWYAFNEADKAMEANINRTDVTDAEVVEAMKQFIKMAEYVGAEAGKAYKAFYTAMYQMFGAGFEFEEHNYRYVTLLATAGKRHRDGNPVKEEEYVTAFRADIQGIRDEIGLAYTEITQKIPQIDPANPPHPVFIVKEIAAIHYLSDKIYREVVVLTTGMEHAIKFMEGKPDEEENNTKKEVKTAMRELMDELNQYQRTHADSIKRALEKVNTRKARSLSPLTALRMRRQARRQMRN